MTNGFSHSSQLAGEMYISQKPNRRQQRFVQRYVVNPLIIGGSGVSRMALFAILGLGLVCQPTGVLRAESDSKTQTNEISPPLPDYRLSIRDKIRVQVFEWRPSRDDVYSWTALNQIYAIDPAGRVSLPLIGQISAVGYTTSELGTLISRRLAKRLDLAAVPDTTVEVTEFRPIYITGYVEKAGEYPYTAGMNVLQGVSVAGGLFRNATLHGLRLEREFLTSAGEYERFAQERERLQAHKARLDAELANADRIAFPAELQSVSTPQSIEYLASLMSKEQSIFELRQKAYQTQATAIGQLVDSLKQEVDTITKRMASQQRQIDLTKAELGGIKQLTNKGLVTQPRLLGLQRNLAQLESEMLRLESDRTRAQQDVSRTKLSKIEFENKRANDLTVELQATVARLTEATQQASVTQQLINETKEETKEQVAFSPLRLASMSTEEKGTGRPEIHYTIVRQTQNDTVEIEATEKTPIQPGDTIKVEMTLPPGNINNNIEVTAPYAPGQTITRRRDDAANFGSPKSAAIEKVTSHSFEPKSQSQPETSFVRHLRHID
jgi:protein involved in polysaccharide export with SLBB domain